MKLVLLPAAAVSRSTDKSHNASNWSTALLMSSIRSREPEPRPAVTSRVLTGLAGVHGPSAVQRAEPDSDSELDDAQAVLQVMVDACHWLSGINLSALWRKSNSRQSPMALFTLSLAAMEIAAI